MITLSPVIINQKRIALVFQITKRFLFLVECSIKMVTGFANRLRDFFCFHLCVEVWCMKQHIVFSYEVVVICVTCEAMGQTILSM
jgi:hypothetical protein